MLDHTDRESVHIPCHKLLEMLAQSVQVHFRFMCTFDFVCEPVQVYVLHSFL